MFAFFCNKKPRLLRVIHDARQLVERHHSWICIDLANHMLIVLLAMFATPEPPPAPVGTYLLTEIRIRNGTALVIWNSK